MSFYWHIKSRSTTTCATLTLWQLCHVNSTPAPTCSSPSLVSSKKLRAVHQLRSEQSQLITATDATFTRQRTPRSRDNGRHVHKTTDATFTRLQSTGLLNIRCVQDLVYTARQHDPKKPQQQWHFKMHSTIANMTQHSSCHATPSACTLFDISFNEYTLNCLNHPLSPAASRYFVYSVIQKWVFHPTARTHWKCENWHPHQISHSLLQKCGNTAPKTMKIWNFAHKFASDGFAWLTKLSAYVCIHR